jgi:hypothetical protein
MVLTETEALHQRFGRWRRLSAILKVLLVLLALADAAGGVSSFLQYRLMEAMSAGSFASPTEAMLAAVENDRREQVLAIAYLAILLVTAVVFLRWILLANRNVRRLGADLSVTPGWAVGWFFVPILNLWKPYRAMRELWKASRAAASWREQPGSVILPVWWILLILSGFVSQGAARLTMKAEGMVELKVASLLEAVSGVTGIAADIAALVLVSGIVALQTAQYAAIGAD